MRKIPNLIFVILGIVSIMLVYGFKIDGTPAFLLIWAGAVFIAIGLFKGNNPFKVMAQFFSNFL